MIRLSTSIAVVVASGVLLLLLPGSMADDSTTPPPPPVAPPSGKCKSYCDKKRPFGMLDSFRTEVDVYVASDEEIQDSKYSCKECKNSEGICDPDLNPFMWYCPPAADLSSECISACNNQRPKGKPESYTLDCKTASPQDRDKCKADCGKCPSYICNNEKFKCPRAAKFEGKCKDVCDNARQYGQVRDVEFECDKLSNPTKQQECMNTCQNKECPSWVCDSTVNKNKYHCPSYELEPNDGCYELCEDERNKDYAEKTNETDGAFKFDCELKNTYDYDYNADAWNDRCDSDCDKCNNNGIVCEKSDGKRKFFHCPAKAPPAPPPMTPVPKRNAYKGACKNRCDGSRGGGNNSYTIDCNARYLTPNEKTNCMTDCVACPADLCDTTKDVTKNIVNAQLKCPKNIENLKKDKERHKREFMAELDAKKKLIKVAEERFKARESELKGYVYACVAAFPTLVAVFIGTLVFLEKRRSAKEDRLIQEKLMKKHTTGKGQQSVPETPGPTPSQAESRASAVSEAPMEPPPSAEPAAKGK